MPNIEVPDNATPGDLLRAVADWYDQHPELAMPSINITEFPRVQKYVDAFAERFGVTPEVVSGREPGREYDRVRLVLHGHTAGTRPGDVHMVMYGPSRDCGDQAAEG